MEFCYIVLYCKNIILKVIIYVRERERGERKREYMYIDKVLIFVKVFYGVVGWWFIFCIYMVIVFIV